LPTTSRSEFQNYDSGSLRNITDKEYGTAINKSSKRTPISPLVINYVKLNNQSNDFQTLLEFLLYYVTRDLKVGRNSPKRISKIQGGGYRTIIDKLRNNVEDRSMFLYEIHNTT
jgi:hypothetical protein